jgi:ribosomal protein S6E (S10)
MTLRAWILATATAIGIGTTAFADQQSEGFKKLNGAQIGRTFPGRTFSDEVHFAFRYIAGGTIEGSGMGKKVARKWKVVKDELCITDSFGENCYGIWKKGAAIKFMIDGNVFSEGLLKSTGE